VGSRPLSRPSALCPVEEGERAWHAGVSFWRGERNVNSASISIEIANPDQGLFFFVDFWGLIFLILYVHFFLTCLVLNSPLRFFSAPLVDHPLRGPDRTFRAHLAFLRISEG